MPATVETFQHVANSAWFGSSDILVSMDGKDEAKLGGFIFSSGRKASDATMTAFREALSQKYGVFGEHAFDTVLGTRAQLHKSLRACDVKAVLSSLAVLKKIRYEGEISRRRRFQGRVGVTVIAMRICSRNWHSSLKDTGLEPWSFAKRRLSKFNGSSSDNFVT